MKWQLFDNEASNITTAPNTFLSTRTNALWHCSFTKPGLLTL